MSDFTTFDTRTYLLAEIEDIEWKVLPYFAARNRYNFPRYPCVYIVSTAGDRVLYVGQTKDPLNRWANHRIHDEMAKIKNIRIRFVKCSSEILRDAEAILIDKLMPSLNETGYPAIVRKWDSTGLGLETLNRTMPLSLSGKLTEGLRVRKIVKTEKNIIGLGKAIGQAQKESGRSISKVCMELGISVNYWNKIINEQTILPHDLLKEIEDLLEVDFNVDV